MQWAQLKMGHGYSYELIKLCFKGGESSEEDVFGEDSSQEVACLIRASEVLHPLGEA